MDAPAEVSVFLPSKLIDYLGSGTPIMGVVPPGTSASLLKRLGGITADPRRTEEVVAALGSAFAALRHERATRPTAPWGDASVRAEFHPDRVAMAFGEMMRNTVHEC
jgi:hypothetical protein